MPEEYKNGYIYVNSFGKKIKVTGMSMTQNSTNYILHVITTVEYSSIVATFKTLGGEISNGYHMIYQGLYTLTEDDLDYEELKDAENLYEYILQVPYRISCMTVLGNSSRLNVSIAAYSYDEVTNYLVQNMTANTMITVAPGTTSDSLDESYSGADVENLWKALGELTSRVQALEGDD